MFLSWVVNVVDGALLAAGPRGQVTPKVMLVAAGCSVTLSVVDVTYVAKGVTLPIYLLDAAVELALIIGWALALVMRRA